MKIQTTASRNFLAPKAYFGIFSIMGIKQDMELEMDLQSIDVQNVTPNLEKLTLKDGHIYRNMVDLFRLQTGRL